MGEAGSIGLQPDRDDPPTPARILEVRLVDNRDLGTTCCDSISIRRCRCFRVSSP
jgi:hypothetical protein